MNNQVGATDVDKEQAQSNYIRAKKAMLTAKAIEAKTHPNDQTESRTAEEVAATDAYNLQRARALGHVSAADVGVANAHPAPEKVDFDGDGTDDYVIIHLTDAEVIPPLPSEQLAIQPGTRIFFRPAGNASAYNISRLADTEIESPVNHSVIQFDDGGSAPPDDGFSVLQLNHTFDFAGSTWTEVYANSDGGLTFGDSSATSSCRCSARIYTAPPMIAALFSDFYPFCGGTAHFYSDHTRSIFTWDHIAHWARLVNTCNVGVYSTFQMILYADGSFEFRYGELDTELIGTDVGNSDAFTAISLGPGQYDPVSYVDYRNLSASGTVFNVGSVVQIWQAATEEEDVVGTLLAVRFYEAVPDQHYDMIMAAGAGWEPNSSFTVSGTVANFNANQYGRTFGIGRGYSSAPSQFGIELESFVSMRGIDVRRGYTYGDMLNPPIRPRVRDIWRDPAAIQKALQNGEPIAQEPRPEIVSSPWVVDLAESEGPYFHERLFNDQFTYYDRKSFFSVTLHELAHRWNTFSALAHPDAEQDPSLLELLVFRRGPPFLGGHPSMFVDMRTENNVWLDTDAKFAPKRPRGDTMAYTAGHVTPLAVDPNDPNTFYDRNDPSIRYPDTYAHHMAMTDEYCKQQGLDLFITTPQAISGGLSTMSLLMAGVVSFHEVADYEMFVVDNVTSPFAAVGFDLDLRSREDIGDGVSQLANSEQNLLFCGTRLNFTLAQVMGPTVTDLLATDAIQDNWYPYSSFVAQALYGTRRPLIGDEGDEVDLAVKAAHPNLYHELNLDDCPIVNDVRCNYHEIFNGGYLLNRTDAVCVDVKTVAPMLYVRPGHTVTQEQRDLMEDWIRVMRDNTGTHGMQGYGARGMVGDHCYIPKFSFGLDQIIH